MDILRGAGVVELVITSREWVHRRVDQIVLGLNGDTTRSTSYDFTLPEEGFVPGSEGRILVPLSFIRKGALRSFSASGPDERPALALTREQNTKIAAGMLASFFPDALAEAGRGDADLERLILDVVDYQDGSSDGDEKLGRLLERASTIMKSHQSGLGEANVSQTLGVFERLARTLLSHFVLLIEVDEDIRKTRSLVKTSYEQEIVFRRRPWEYTTFFTFPVPDFGGASSHHVEVRVPADLSIRSLSIRDQSTLESVVDLPEGNTALAHVSLNPEDRFSQATVRVEASPAKSGIAGFTKMAALAVLVITALLVLEKTHITHLTVRESIPSSGVSIVLFAPALLLSWLARTAEHELVRILFKPLRFCLGAFALFFISLGALAAIPLQPDGRAWAWALVWAASSAGILGFLAYRLNFRRWRMRRRKS